MEKISVSTQKTSDDKVLKFVCNYELVEGVFEFNNVNEAKSFPIIATLFQMPFVEHIVLEDDNFQIRCIEMLEWDMVSQDVVDAIETMFSDGIPLYLEEKIDESTEVDQPEKRNVIIFPRLTPNPEVMKFASGIELVPFDVEFKSITEIGTKSPLALKLFQFPFVKEVFISDKYVSVTKNVPLDWAEFFIEIKEFLESYLSDGNLVLNPDYVNKEKKRENDIFSKEDLDETSLAIIDILEQYVKPAVANDGGNISFNGYDKEKKVVHVLLQGACSGCPSSTLTLKQGIETMLKEMLPGMVERVSAVNG